MSEEWTLADEAAASLLSQKALTNALFTTLKEKGLLSAEDIDAIFHDAASALERAEKDNPTFIPRARAILDRTSRNLAAGPSGDRS